MHSVNTMQSSKLYKFHVSRICEVFIPSLKFNNVQRANKPQQHKEGTHDGGSQALKCIKFKHFLPDPQEDHDHKVHANQSTKFHCSDTTSSFHHAD